VACLEVLVAGDACNEGEGVVVRQGHLIVLVVAFLMGCTVLLMAGASGVLAQASQHNKQKLSGTNGRDTLRGGDSDDTIRGLGGNDNILHGLGDDVVYGGGGDDDVFPDSGKDVIYGGDGNDKLDSGDDGGDKLYCGAGRDKYIADKNDYVDSSCEKEPLIAQVEAGACERIDKKLDENRPLSREERRLHAGFCTYTGEDVIGATSSASASPTPVPLGGTGGPAILLPAAALLVGSGILTYAILRRR
jgi:RTX calcium-binding nonapeptide repeat (4 copies)